MDGAINIEGDEGGTATLTGFGRNEKRILQQLQRSLPADYVTDLILFDDDSHAAQRRTQTREMRLYVQRKDVAGERVILDKEPQIDLVERLGRAQEAERQRLLFEEADDVGGSRA